MPIAIPKAREALALAGDLGMRPLAAQCRVRLGKVYRRRTGQREQAREHLATATTICHDMDTRFWLEEVEAALVGGQRPPVPT